MMVARSDSPLRLSLFTLWCVLTMKGSIRSAHAFQRFARSCWKSGRLANRPAERRLNHDRRIQLFTTSTTSDAVDDSSKHQKTYHLQGATTPKNKSGVTVHTTNTGHTLQTDLPKKMGGKDTAPQPVETLLAALAGCTQATALFVGRHLQLPHPHSRLILDRLEFDLTAVRDERGALQLPLDKELPVPSRLQQVQGTVTVYAARNVIGAENLDLLKEQTELRCPVANMMIAGGCRMDVKWIDGNAPA